MTPELLDQRLHDEGIVSLETAEWEALAPAYDELERHATHLAGDLVIVQTASGPMAVEEPSLRERVVRLIGDEPDAVRAFVKDRLDTYERMWDGCGCKVEYYR